MSTNRTQAHPLRKRVHEILEAADVNDRPSRICDAVIIMMIIANVLAVVFGSVFWVEEEYSTLLNRFEVFSVLFFTIEYGLRIWSSVEHPPIRHLPAWKARFNFALSPFLLIDLIAILPFYLSMLFGADLRILRVLRLLRFFKILRYSPALQVLIRVFYNEGRALLGALLIMTALLLFAATGIHFIEGEVQPESFSDIPSSLWWAIATLTTVGFGDVVPITPLGKLWGGIFMIFGLGMFALPIGIISSGFAQEINRREFVINWNLVARVPLFNHLEATEVAEIMGLLHSLRFPQGAIITEQGEMATGMFFIVSGNVELDNGDDQTVIEPGAFFGEAGLLSKGAYKMTARAVTNVHLLQLDTNDFEFLLHKNEKLNNHIRQVATSRMMGKWDLDEEDQI